MHPRSMLFTLFGVYIRHFGGEIWLGSLTRLMAEFGFSEQAVRAAVGRLQIQGWVTTRRLGKKSYCSLSQKGVSRVDEAAKRIYNLKQEPWNGVWCLVTYTISEAKRSLRDQLRIELSWRGFGPLSTSTWLSPHDFSPQLQKLIQNYNIEGNVDIFSSRCNSPLGHNALVRKCWNLGEVSEHYKSFISSFRPLYIRDYHKQNRETLADQDCFIERSKLVHEYRKFLFIDPALPSELLPPDWDGYSAAQLFYQYDQLLAPGAGRYFSNSFVAAPDMRLSSYQIEQMIEAQIDPFSTQDSFFFPITLRS